MSNLFPTTPNTILEERRGDVERIDESGAQYFKIEGIVQVIGTGEAMARLLFPVYFIDKPTVSFGAELDYGAPTVTHSTDGTDIDSGFPTWSATVLTWDFRFKSDGSSLYVGALLGIATRGPNINQNMNVHWTVQGTALRGPVGDDQ